MRPTLVLTGFAHCSPDDPDHFEAVRAAVCHDDVDDRCVYGRILFCSAGGAQEIVAQLAGVLPRFFAGATLAGCPTGCDSGSHAEAARGIAGFSHDHDNTATWAAAGGLAEAGVHVVSVWL